MSEKERLEILKDAELHIHMLLIVAEPKTKTQECVVKNAEAFLERLKGVICAPTPH